MKPVFVSLPVLIALGACSVAPEGQSIHDPYEQTNRQIHEFNVGLDRALLRPASQAANTLPDGVTQTVTNFADNVALPGLIANGILQGDIKGASTNTFRFVINSTVGFYGLFDVADIIGLYEEDTDFGETLAVWGVHEGAYVELPVLGPSTERDAVGEIVDMLYDPLGNWVTDEQLAYGTAANVADKIITRGAFGNSVDSVLYDSADGYAQARLLYLENRRYELGQEQSDAYIDPYADPYFDPYEDQ